MARVEQQAAANDAVDQADKRRSRLLSLMGMSFILERGSTLAATMSRDDSRPPAEDERSKVWVRTPFTIAAPGTSVAIPLESNPEGLCRLDCPAGTAQADHAADQRAVSLFLLNKHEPPECNRIRHRETLTALRWS